MIDPELVSAMRARMGRRHTFVIVFLDSGTYAFSDSQRVISYEGRDFIPAAGFGSIDFKETEISKMSGALELKFSAAFAGEDGAPYHSELQAAIGKTLRGEPLQGRRITLFRAVTNLAGTQVLHDPSQRMSGVIDVVAGNDNGDEGPELTLRIEDRAYLETVIAPRRFSLADHQRLTPGSTFFEQSALIRTKDINWGRSA